MKRTDFASRIGRTPSCLRLVSALIALLILHGGAVAAQGQSEPSRLTAGAKPAPARASVESAESDDAYFKQLYRRFYETYRLGPEDQIAIRVFGQPDYTLEQVTVSPVGRIYHPLAGEIDVVGLTVPKLVEKLRVELTQYIIDPKVSVSLLVANSAKIGVVGDVNNPGIVVMSKPMTILEALSASGGVSDTGSKSGITVVRQLGDGRTATMKVNYKRILEGKAGPEENITLQAGDTVVVHGNLRKKISNVTSLIGFGSFRDFLLRRY